jgi:hypothetical protein
VRTTDTSSHPTLKDIVAGTSTELHFHLTEYLTKDHHQRRLALPSAPSMATPTQGQNYGGNNAYPTPASQGGGGGSSAQQPAYSTERSSQSNSVTPYQQQQQQSQQSQQQQPTTNPPFERYCVIHIATTCDEHGVYVTKDSAEVIELGWVVVDAKNPEREVRDDEKARMEQI